MHVEHDGIARGHHGDRVANDRRRRIGRRCDGPDDAVGCIFGQRQPVVAGDGRGREYLCARGLARNQAILYELVLDSPEAGLRVRESRTSS